MQSRHATNKIDNKATTRKNIAPNKNVVIRRDAGQPKNISIYLDAGRKEQSHPKIVAFDGFAPGLASDTDVDRLEIKFACQPRANSGARCASVDQSENAYHTGALKGHRRDADCDRWPVFDKVIDLLGNSDLGPAGFFVICHRDSS